MIRQSQLKILWQWLHMYVRIRALVVHSALAGTRNWMAEGDTDSVSAMEFQHAPAMYTRNFVKHYM